VEADGLEIGRIGLGGLVLVGVESGDAEEDAEYIAGKCGSLRVFDDPSGRLNFSVRDVRGSLLVVSQFTLCADTRKGRRPSFAAAAPPEEGERLYGVLIERILARGIEVSTGRFQARMQVHLINDGPVTLLLDSRKGR